MEPSRRALILGDEPRVVITVARSIARATGMTSVVAPTSHRPRLRSRAIHSVHPELAMAKSPADRIKAVQSIADATGCDVVIPVNDTALALLAERREQLDPRLQVASASPEAVRSVLDKEASVRIAEAAGIPVPGAWRFQPHEWNDAPFPIVGKASSKRSVASFPFKAKRFDSAVELRAFAAERPDLLTEMLFQEYVPGVGVGVELLIWRGQTVLAFQHERLLELPPSGGVAVVARGMAINPLLRQYSEQLLHALGWEGPAMVEFRYDPASDRAAFMEVNGRFWGSIALPVASGVDFPASYVALLRGTRPENLPRQTESARVFRWAAGDLLRLLLELEGDGRFSEKVRAVLGWSRRSVGRYAPATFAWSDPIAATLEFWSVGSGVLRRVAGRIRRVLRNRGAALTARTIRTSWLVGFRVLGPRRILGNPEYAAAAGAVVVCHGNIMRSAVGEAALRRELEQLGFPDLRIRSAGVAAVPGRSADERMKRAAQVIGINLDSHAATRFADLTVDASEIVVAADYRVAARLLADGLARRSQMVMLGTLARSGGWTSDEVPDPFRRPDADLDAAVGAITLAMKQLARLMSKRAPGPADLATDARIGSERR